MSLTDRTQYIAGLRELADLLDKNDDLPVPSHGEIQWLYFSARYDHDEQKTTAATIVRRITGAFAKEITDELFRYKTHLGGPEGLELEVIVHRDAVCERVVTGTEEITRRVPDPELMAKVPEVELTETVETVEWRCLPLLDDRQAVAS